MPLPVFPIITAILVGKAVKEISHSTDKCDEKEREAEAYAKAMRCNENALLVKGIKKSINIKK